MGNVQLPPRFGLNPFIRAKLQDDAIAFDRADGALVIAAGVPRTWLARGAIHVGPLPTYSGTIDVVISGETQRTTFELSGTARPARFVVRSPDDRPIRAARVDGAPAGHENGEVVVTSLPARVVFEY